jgi:hypothetical protein
MPFRLLDVNVKTLYAKSANVNRLAKGLAKFRVA